MSKQAEKKVRISVRDDKSTQLRASPPSAEIERDKNPTENSHISRDSRVIMWRDKSKKTDKLEFGRCPREIFILYVFFYF